MANQREHLILLLANMDIRNRTESYEVNHHFLKKLPLLYFSFSYLMDREILNFKFEIILILLRTNKKFVAAP